VLTRGCYWQTMHAPNWCLPMSSADGAPHVRFLLLSRVHTVSARCSCSAVALTPEPRTRIRPRLMGAFRFALLSTSRARPTHEPARLIAYLSLPPLQRMLDLGLLSPTTRAAHGASSGNVPPPRTPRHFCHGAKHDRVCVWVCAWVEGRAVEYIDVL
jgi:hypothetical protein